MRATRRSSATADPSRLLKERILAALELALQGTEGPQRMVDVLRRLHAHSVEAMASEVVSAIQADREQRAGEGVPQRFTLKVTRNRRLQEVLISRADGVAALSPVEGRVLRKTPATPERAPTPSSEKKLPSPERQRSTPKSQHTTMVKHLLKLSPTAFEGVIERLLVALGVQEVVRTPPTNDAGVDVRGVLVIEELMRVRVAVQVKRYAGNVSRPDVQKLRGSLSHGEVGWFFTTGGYSDGARAEAQAHDRQPISLIAGLEVAELLIKYGVALSEGPA
ncbi:MULTISPECIES: restriction endonuclease [Deinococcus]|uniref:Restriction endonuclease n=1 Tax=Deinococcus rufus TaxID=2136097 RepID=A0ABV7Z9D8_9DEIO|nr:restriction endonuclease [Deinococcus sp. AB2017081]WQE94657.1 restriction endonuclease [Deinococcus sp. AB2017081]